MVNAIGLDFGTNSCRVACLIAERPNLIPNTLKEAETPTWVAQSAEGRTVIGRQACPAHYSAGNMPLVGIKKALGGRQTLWLGGKMWTPTEVVTLLFQTLRQDAERVLGQPVFGAVITVPTLSGNLQRANTRQAAEMAGFTTIRLLNEVTAAALGQGENDRRLLVYAIGAGSYEVAVVEVNGRACKTVWIEGDAQIGGNAFDRKIVNHLLEKIKQNYKIDLSTDPRALWLLANSAEQCKIILSTETQTQVEIPHLNQDKQEKTIHLSLEIARKEINTLLHKAVEQTVILAQQALAGAKLTIHDIDDVLLVGGSTRWPLVQQQLQEVFQKETKMLPLEGVVMGAARQTAILEEEVPSKKPPEEIIAVSPTYLPQKLPPSPASAPTPTRIPGPSLEQQVQETLQIMLQGKIDQAIVILQELNTRYPADEKVKAGIAQVYYAKGKQLERAGKWEEALKVLEISLTYDKTNKKILVEFYILKARQYKEQKRFQEATKLLQSVLRSLPIKNGPIAHCLADVCLAWGRHLSKEGHINEALVVTKLGLDYEKNHASLKDQYHKLERSQQNKPNLKKKR